MALSGALFSIAVPATTASGQTFDVVAFFHGGDVAPYSALIQGTDGKLYGTTLGGGSNGQGMVFRIDPSGQGFTILHSFVGNDGTFPYARLLQANDGLLYGTTTAGGGPADGGTIFRVAADGSAFTTLHEFGSVGDGAHPYGALIQAADGLLYGTTSEGGSHSAGIIFKIDTAGVTLTKIHDFTLALGAKPLAGLVQTPDGYLYGATSSGAGGNYGMIFRIDTAGAAYTPMHAFLGPVGGEGARPLGDLIDGGDGYLYGTTELCGSGCDFMNPGAGTIFRIATFDAAFQILHSFAYTDGANPQAGLLRGTDGKLYGTTLIGGGVDGAGTIFRIDTDGAGFASLKTFVFGDGVGTNPRAGLLQASDGNLYGTTSEAGLHGYGTIFRIDTSGSSLTTVQDFVRDEGMTPNPGVVQGVDGFLYGTTIGGGLGYGTIFKAETGGSALTTLHSFVEAEGTPYFANVIQGSDGRLYGSTVSGPTEVATIYRVDTSGADFTILRTLTGLQGFPNSLIQGADGDLYGTTSAADGSGTIFKMDTAGTTLTPLHVFDSKDGVGVGNLSSLIQATDGKLYGTTSRGGNAGDGTIFRLDTDGTSFETVYSFDDFEAEGAWPGGGLVQASDGNLYGALTIGFGFSGSIFKIDPDGVSLLTLHEFVSGEGTPRGALVEASDGALYGATTLGGTGPCSSLGCGTLFRVDKNGTAFTKQHDFIKSDGQSPSALIQAADGALYGTTLFGGIGTPPGIGNGTGVLFKLSLCGLAQPPAVAAPHCLPPDTADHIATATGGASDTWDWTVFGGTITAGQGTPTITFTSGGAGTRLAVYVVETDASGCVGSAVDYAQVDFDDVPSGDPFYPYVCTIGGDGITAGCGGGLYCPGDAVRRDQMAVFLLKAKHGASYAPPPCTSVFSDVPCPGAFADWVEQLAAEEITAGCGNGNYCPSSPVTRAQMAVFLLKASLGSDHVPPACTGTVFNDVPCTGGPFDAWIEELAGRGITGGCGGGDYCPGNENTRGQMAVFLTKTFGLFLSGP